MTLMGKPVSQQWRTRFAILPVLVGWENGQPVKVWGKFYQWRYTHFSGWAAEYRSMNPGLGFKPSTWEFNGT